tara:strand:- start:157 stop:561 length:405 start_codon:yes stop_codon:yes gene_type:complete
MNVLNELNKYYKNVNKKKPELKSYKNTYTLEKRKNEALRIKEKYPNRVPIICERYTVGDPEIDRKKYLVPDDLSISNFIYVIRKRIKLKPENSLYLFVNGKILNGTGLLAQIYEKNKDNDGFLYIKYTLENTFG